MTDTLIPARTSSVASTDRAQPGCAVRSSKASRRFVTILRKDAIIPAGVLFACFALLNGCGLAPSHAGPSIRFTRVPHAGEGGPNRQDSIAGRVIGARPGDRIVLFARWGPWWVQPLVDHPFTDIRGDGTFLNMTHFGTEYAAVLVDENYRPPATTDALEGQPGVLSIATAKGRPPFWLTWWFTMGVIVFMVCIMLAVLRARLNAITSQINMRFEERLAERARIARELHDSLLQGFQGLMFRLQAARDMLPARPTEAMQALETILDRGDQVIAEGRDTVEDLRSLVPSTDIAQAITSVGEELTLAHSGAAAAFRVLVEGQPRDLDVIVRDEIYRIAREALRNSFAHSRARQIEAQITYGDSQFLLHIRDDGIGFDPDGFERGQRAGHWGLPGMRERAAEFGGTLKIRSERGAGTEIQLHIPSSAAYPQSSVQPGSWFSRRKASNNHERQP